MKVLVIIVTYNAMPWIQKCLDSVWHSDMKADVFIIDNGSSDGTQEYIKKHYQSAIFVQSDKNLGFGAANNLGFVYAIRNRYDFVYLLNQDAWIFPDTIEKMIVVANLHPQYGILSPMQLAGDEVTIQSGFKKCLSIPANWEDSNNDAIVEVYRVMAAHWLIPMNILCKIGGFSPTFFHYGEDWNYLDRLHYWGYKVGVVHSAKAVHDCENRKITNEKTIYLKNVTHLIRLSDLNHNYLLSILKSFICAIYFALKTHNISMLTDFVKIILKSGAIYHNRALSKVAGAFLQN